MRLIHTTCLKTLILTKRTIVSQPMDASWPRDFQLSLPFCVACLVFPPLEEIKKEVGK